MEIDTPQPFGILQDIQGRVRLPFGQDVYQCIQTGKCPNESLIEYAEALDFLGIDDQLENVCKRLAEIKNLNTYPSLFYRIARHLDIDTRRQLNIYEKIQIPTLNIPVRPYMFKHAGDLMISIDREKDVYCFVRKEYTDTIIKHNGNYIIIRDGYAS